MHLPRDRLVEVTAGGGKELNIFLSQYSKRGTPVGEGKEAKDHPVKKVKDVTGVTEVM